MKNKIKFWIIAIALIVVITNLPPINYFLQQSYSYRNEDNSFTYTEESGKGLDYQAGIIRFNRFKKFNPDNPNKTLFRTFTLKPWRFWEWWQMIKHYERFKLPYYSKVS